MTDRTRHLCTEAPEEGDPSSRHDTEPVLCCHVSAQDASVDDGGGGAGVVMPVLAIMVVTTAVVVVVTKIYILVLCWRQ